MNFDPATLLLFMAAGLGAGFVSGLMGVGGGIILTPMLHYVWGTSWADAVALSLLVIALQAPVGIWRHHRKGAVDLRLAWPLVAGGAVGVAAATLAFPFIRPSLLKLLFAIVLGLAAWNLVRPVPASARQNDSGDQTNLKGQPATPPGRLPRRTLTGLTAGLAAGMVSRFAGVGGGIVTVPALAFAGTAIHVAVGTSLVAVWTNAAWASMLNWPDAERFTQGILLALAAMAGSTAGVAVAHRLNPTGLSRVVAAGMVAGAIAMAVEALT